MTQTHSMIAILLRLLDTNNVYMPEFQLWYLCLTEIVGGSIYVLLLWNLRISCVIGQIYDFAVYVI